MKKSKFTEEQIAFALKQAELGTSVEEVCRKMGISDATFYNWRKKFGELGPSELRRLKQLEEKNAKLKRLVADLSLDKAMLAGRTRKKSLKPLRIPAKPATFRPRPGQHSGRCRAGVTRCGDCDGGGYVSSTSFGREGARS